jgi:hypothetical protein
MQVCSCSLASILNAFSPFFACAGQRDAKREEEDLDWHSEGNVFVLQWYEHGMTFVHVTAEMNAYGTVFLDSSYTHLKMSFSKTHDEPRHLGYRPSVTDYNMICVQS